MRLEALSENGNTWMMRKRQQNDDHVSAPSFATNNNDNIGHRRRVCLIEESFFPPRTRTSFLERRSYSKWMSAAAVKSNRRSPLLPRAGFFAYPYAQCALTLY